MSVEKELAEEIESNQDFDSVKVDHPPHPSFLQSFKKGNTSFFIDFYRIAVVAIYCILWLSLHEYVEKKVIAVMVLGIQLTTGWIVDIRTSWNIKVDSKTFKNFLTFMTIIALIAFVDGQTFWHSFLSFVLLVIALGSEIVMYSEFPNQNTTIQLIWIIPIGIQFICWLFSLLPSQSTQITFIELIVIPQFLAFLPAILRPIFDVHPFSKTEFFYSQMNHSQMIKYCFLPFYKNVSTALMLFIIVQNCFYLFVMKKMRPSIIAAKMGRQNSRKNIFRDGQNTYTIVTSAQQRKKLLSFHSGKKLNFDEEICSKCQKKQASFLSHGCRHVTICLKCLKGVRRDFSCMICNRTTARDYYSVRSNLPDMIFLKEQGIDPKKYCLNQEYWASKKNSIEELQEDERNN